MNKYKYVGGNGPIRTKVVSGDGTEVTDGFTRIVHGGRGAYVEFRSEQVWMGNLRVPSGEVWRLHSKRVYYIEYRTVCGVKVYHQKRTVPYADYKVDMWYVSPRDLQGFEVCGKYILAEVSLCTRNSIQLGV